VGSTTRTVSLLQDQSLGVSVIVDRDRVRNVRVREPRRRWIESEVEVIREEVHRRRRERVGNLVDHIGGVVGSRCDELCEVGRGTGIYAGERAYVKQSRTNQFNCIKQISSTFAPVHPRHTPQKRERISGHIPEYP